MAIPVLNDMLIALSLLTRLPVPHADWSDESRPPARAAWAYPLAGLVVSALGASFALGAMALGIAPPIAALVMLATTVIATGAMHEDGLADCADGFWGGWDRERRLEIMKDSVIGVYGMLALLFSFAARWTLYTALLVNGTTSLGLLLVPAILSRACMVCVMQALPHARATGLSASTGHPGQLSTIIALLIGFGGAAFVLAELSLLVMLAAILAATAVALIARAKIAGQTGDVLGAAQQITEIAALLVLSATL